jgi:hypothetical protein
VKRLLLVTATALALAAGCGSSSPSHTTTAAADRLNPNCLTHPATPAQRRVYRHLLTILAVMRRTKAHDQMSRLTDRFLLAEETSGLSAYIRNRLIDHAIAYATPICQDCFQGLEAARPIARPCSS